MNWLFGLQLLNVLHGEAANRNEIHAQSDGGQLSGYLGLVFPHVKVWSDVWK